MSDERDNAATLGCAFIILILLMIVVGTVVKGCQDGQSQNIAKQL